MSDDPNDPAYWDAVDGGMGRPTRKARRASRTAPPAPAPAPPPLPDAPSGGSVDPNDPGYWPGGQAAAAPSLLDTVGHSIAQGGSALLHGLGDVYDMAAIPQNALASLLGADWLRAKPAAEHIRAAGIPDPEPNAANAIIQGTAGAVPYLAAGEIAVPARGATAAWNAWNATKAARPATAVVAESLAAKPASQLAAGAGAGLLHQLADDNTDNPVARVAAPIVGSLLGGGVTLGAPAAWKYLTGRLGNEGMDALNSIVRTISPEKRAAAIDELRFRSPEPENQAAAIDNEMARMRNARTTAEVLDPVVGEQGPFALQKAMQAGKVDIAQGSQFANRAAALREARDNVLDAIPAPVADPGAIRPVIEAQAQQAGQDLRAALGGLGPATPPLPAGRAIQGQFAAERAASSADVGAAREAIDPNVQVPVRDIRRDIVAAGQREFISQDPQSARWAPLNEILTTLSGQRTLGFADLQKIRSNALDGARQAYNSGDKELGRVFDATAEAVRTGLEAGLPDDAAAQFRAFQQAATERGQQFGGPVAGKLGKQEYGRPDVQPEQAPGLFFKPGAEGGAGMRQFGELFTPSGGTLDPVAANAMRGHVADHIAQNLVDPTTGQVDARGLAQFRQDHRDALTAVPALGLDRAVGNVDAAARLASERGAPNVTTLPEHQRNVAQTILGTENIGDAVSTILNGANPARDIRDLMTRVQASPNAQEGVRRAILDDWGRASVTNTPRAGGLASVRQSGATKWWNANQDALAAAFTPEERARLSAVHDSLWSEAKVAQRMAPTGSDTAPNLSAAEALASNALGESAPTRGRAVLEEAVKAEPIGIGRFVRGFAQKRADAVMGDIYHMMLDPEVAGAALRRATPQQIAELAGTIERRSGIRRGLQATGRGAAELARKTAPALGTTADRSYGDEP
ncbi:MAG TPA: hypothetical protein VGR63_15300 [Casimicrobiaceae bacterium]|jgi:hypothetical protein|nr:hypothetical protein [Casimicrobiaceae bacterium]